jgi:hypothetical protein
MNKDDIIAELRRVAEQLGKTSLTRQQFNQYGRISAKSVEYKFGSWNQAVEAAGLVATKTGAQNVLLDEELLEDIIRLTRDLGKQPTLAELSAKGYFSLRPYEARWGNLAEACKVAYAKYGFPLTPDGLSPEKYQTVQASPNSPKSVISKTSKPQALRRSKKVQYGEPMDFRGLRHAPINEQGVVYLFGMVSRELGFLIESVKAPYPDCEGKRRVDQKGQRWERVLIEFEYQSSNFRLHKHDPDGCDLIVCWIHDWEDCQIEVLELKSAIKYLPNQ